MTIYLIELVDALLDRNRLVPSRTPAESLGWRKWPSPGGFIWAARNNQGVCDDNQFETVEDIGDVRSFPRVPIPTFLGEFPNCWFKPKSFAVQGLLWSPSFQYEDHDVLIGETQIRHLPSEHLKTGNIGCKSLNREQTRLGTTSTMTIARE